MYSTCVPLSTIRNFVAGTKDHAQVQNSARHYHIYQRRLSDIIASREVPITRHGTGGDGVRRPGAACRAEPPVMTRRRIPNVACAEQRKHLLHISATSDKGNI